MLRIAYRLIFSVFYTAKITFEIYLRGKWSTDFGVKEAMLIRQRWARKLMHGIGVRVKTSGTPPNFPCILVCNHRSYLDPIIILQDVNGYPVSKAEVENWPILGYGAKLAGILYLQREETGSRIATLRAMANTVNNGFPVILFPEGTTSGENSTLEFKKGTFQIAAKLGFAIVPAAIHFADERDFWVGTESFGSHAGRRFREKHIHCELRYGVAIHSKDTDELQQKAQQWIDAQIMEMRQTNHFNA